MITSELKLKTSSKELVDRMMAASEDGFIELYELKWGLRHVQQSVINGQYEAEIELVEFREITR